MSSTKNKEDVTYIINPLTGRRVQVGGATYFQLVRKGLVGDEEIPDIPKKKEKIGGSKDVLRAECEDPEHAAEIKNQLLKSHPLPEDQTYKIVGNKIYVTKKNGKKITRQQQVEEMTKSALKTVKEVVKNPDSVKKLENDEEDLLRDIRTLLQQNLINKNAKLEDIQENSVLKIKKSDTKKVTNERECTKAHKGGKKEMVRNGDAKESSGANARKRAPARKIYSDTEQSVYAESTEATSAPGSEGSGSESD